MCRRLRGGPPIRQLGQELIWRASARSDHDLWASGGVVWRSAQSDRHHTKREIQLNIASPSRIAIAAFVSTAALLAPAAAFATTAPKVTAKATFKAGGSIGQIWVTDATAGDTLILADSHSKVVQTGTADAAGSLIFRGVKVATGYTVRRQTGRVVAGTSKVSVLAPGKNPSSAYYKGIKLVEGLNYVKMRDGIELAMTVRPPKINGVQKHMTDGPFPTIIEHSGYETAAPHDLFASIALGVGKCAPASSTCDPLLPDSSTAVGALIAPMLGFATVSVQMRGSGCSGGAFDLFDLPTTYDGYDMVETVAAQSWAKGHKVGMGGISFSGISQMFAAGTNPPHLAGITPMSITDDTYTSTGYPGGIWNTGFALSWISQRMDDAQPAPAGGQMWAKAMVARSDVLGQKCLANQKLRLQTQDAVAQSADNPYRDPALFNNRAAATWVSKIKAPVFLVGSFQDEQTGGHFPEALGDLKNNKNVWLSMQNGVHADSLGPSTITRWVEFLSLFVGDQIPKVPASVISLSSALYTQLADSAALPVQQSRFADMANTPANVAAAKATFKRDSRVRLLMDNGNAVSGALGAIGAPWELDYAAWPITQLAPTNYYLGASGALTTTAPGSSSTVSYVGDPSARPLMTLHGAGAGDAWKAQPRYDWQPLASGKGVGFTTAALGSDLVIGGPSSLDLYLKSSAPNTDLQVTMSEVRPDGKETYVQNGWLRASHRKLNDAKSTANDPFPTHLAADAANLPADVFTLVRIPIFPAAHAFRVGSKIRITVEAPGGDRPSWNFQTIENGTITNTISIGGVQASRLVLPVITGANAKGTSLPAPTALRGEPSRTYLAASNGG